MVAARPRGYKCMALVVVGGRACAHVLEGTFEWLLNK